MTDAKLKRSSAWPPRGAASSHSTNISQEARDNIAKTLGLPLSDGSYVHLEAQIAHLVAEMNRPDPRELCKELKRVIRGEEPLDQDHWRAVTRLLDIEERKAGGDEVELGDKQLAERALQRLKTHADPCLNNDDGKEPTTRRGNSVEPMRDHFIVCAAKALFSVGITPKAGHSGSNKSAYGSLADLLTILYETVPALKPLADLSPDNPAVDRKTSPIRRFYRSNVIRRAQTMDETGQLSDLR